MSSRFLAGRTRDELESSYFCSDEVVSCRFLAGRTRELEISRLTNSGVPKSLEIPTFWLRAIRNKQLLAQALSVIIELPRDVLRVQGFVEKHDQFRLSGATKCCRDSGGFFQGCSGCSSDHLLLLFHVCARNSPGLGELLVHLC